jgi:hypothetical protein
MASAAVLHRYFVPYRSLIWTGFRGESAEGRKRAEKRPFAAQGEH